MNKCLNVFTCIIALFLMSCEYERMPSDSQVLKAQPLQEIYVAIKDYANQNNGQLPENINFLKEYDLSNEKIANIKKKYLYWGKNKKIKENSNDIILIENPKNLSRDYMILLLIDGKIEYPLNTIFDELSKSKKYLRLQPVNN